MWKRTVLLLAVLTLVFVSNLSPCCRVEINGVPFAAPCSPSVLRRAKAAARASLEEICAGEADMPRLRCRWRLWLKKPTGSETELSAAILEAAPEVMLASNVYVNGVFLGSVSSEAALRERLDRCILGQKPNWALSGFIREPVVVRREYTRRAALTTLDDMALLVTGMSPVIYFDSDGYMCRA